MLGPYVLPHADLTITAGELDVTGKVEVAPAGGKIPKVTFTGDVAIEGFKSVDNALKLDFLNIGKLQLGKLRYAMAPDSLSIDGIDIREPYARVIISPEQVVNIAAVLDPEGSAKALEQRRAAAQNPAAKSKAQATVHETTKPVEKATAPAEDTPADSLPIRIGEVRIDRMRMNFADNFIQPNFSADVQQLSGTIAKLSSAPDARATVDLKGKLGEFSPVTIKGQLQPFAFDRFTDMRLRFEDIQLPIFNPYSGSLAGYNITKGQLTTELHYRIRNRQLDAQHKIRVDQLEWGEATSTKSEATLPLKFATALLKDRKGVIDLDVPVGGTLDDPSFRIGPIAVSYTHLDVYKRQVHELRRIRSLEQRAEHVERRCDGLGDDVPAHHPGCHRPPSAGRLRADRHRSGAHADPPDQHPRDQHFRESGAQHGAGDLCGRLGAHPALALLGGADRRGAGGGRPLSMARRRKVS